MLVAGTIADIDTHGAHFGPAAFLTFYRSYFHSRLAAVLYSLLLTLPFLIRKLPLAEKQNSRSVIFIATLSASVLHLVMDVCQSAGVVLLWPFSSRRFALDWVAKLDLWV